MIKPVEAEKKQHLDGPAAGEPAQRGTQAAPLPGKEPSTRERVHDVGYQMLREFDALCKKYDIQYWICFGSLLGTVRHQGFIPWDADIDVCMTREEFPKLLQHLDELPKDWNIFSPASYGKDRYYDCVLKMVYKHLHYQTDPGALDFYGNIYPDGMHIDVFFFDKTYKDWRGSLQRLELSLIYGLLNTYRYKGVRIQSYPLHWKIAQKVLDVFGRCIPLSKMFQWQDRVAKRYNGREDCPYYYVSNAGLDINHLLPASCFTQTVPAAFGPLTVPITKDADQVLHALYGDYWQLPPEEAQIFPDVFFDKA